MAKSAKDPAGALRFYGVIDAEEATGAHKIDGTSIIPLRDLGAVVAPAKYVRVKPGDDELADYVRVVDECFKHGPIVPAPVGTVFRNVSVLKHWLELHYAKLHEALGTIERRGGTQPPYDYVRMELGA